MKHIVIGSIPRSGSTFIQRQIQQNLPSHGSGPETWFLQRAGSEDLDINYFSELGANTAQTAVKYYRNKGASGLYNKALISGFETFLDLLCQKCNKNFFIEKTPRNLFFMKDLQFSEKIFPVQIVRNPLDIIISYLFTFSAGNYYKDRMNFDLVFGFRQLRINAELGLPIIKYEEATRNEEFVRQFLSYSGFETGDNYGANVFDLSEFGVLGDPVFSGSNKYIPDRLKDKKISFHAYKNILRIMQSPDVRFIYEYYYTPDLFETDLQRLMRMRSPWKLTDMLLAPVSTVYSYTQLNILKTKVKSRHFFLR